MAFTSAFTCLAGHELPVHSGNTLIVGSGAAALGAALQLVRRGQRDVALVTADWDGGTSRNAGSDKQTYFRVALAGDPPDSPRRAAEDLFAGGAMHGDLALAEAEGSLPAFFNLTNLGVPFPHDRWGAYPGYRTDNDERGRATSAGPRTSRQMCACLGRDVRAAGVRIFHQHQVIALLTHAAGGERVICGAVALDKANCTEPHYGLVLFNAVNVVLATGGPGGMFRASAYPESQVGSLGMALEIGAVANNLTEFQFGLAALRPRWNVSGSYQQVIPRYVSVDDAGSEHEFLRDAIPDLPDLAGTIFRKGYEWPFDAGRIAQGGSSLVDLLVHRETELRGRRVFLDFRRNPSPPAGGKPFACQDLGPEALDYLQQSGALHDTPWERLQALNPAALDFFRAHGTDLAQEMLEVAVCVQHCNGGLAVNAWWESNVRHLFPVGEVAGTHGVRRPGGAALNAGQVGGARAALYISRHYSSLPPAVDEFTAGHAPRIQHLMDDVRNMLVGVSGDALTPGPVMQSIQDRMSTCAGPVREADEVAGACGTAWELVDRVRRDLRATDCSGLARAFQARDLCLTHALVLEAIAEYLQGGGASRGSALVRDPEGDLSCEEWRFALDETRRRPARDAIQEIQFGGHRKVRVGWTPVRPIPDQATWFETLWNDFRSGDIVR